MSRLLFRDTLVPKPPGAQTPGGADAADRRTARVSGKAEPVVSDHCCGDNYVAKANACYDPDVTEFDCTGRLVAWKRVYLEIDRMYQVGTDLTTDYVGLSADLYVEDGTVFSVGQEVVVFDADHPVGETATVVTAAPGIVTLDRVLSNTYAAGYSGSGRGAAVAWPAGGYYEADVGRLVNAFGHLGNVRGADGGCFVDFRSTPDGANAVPYEELLTELSSSPTMEAYSGVWFANAGDANCVHIIGADYCEDRGDGILGQTIAAANVQCTYVGQIAGRYPGSVGDVARDVTAHEAGHQFGLSSTDRSHPSAVWCHEGPTTDYCLMSYERDREDSYTEFCSISSAHIYQVRHAPDGL